MFPVEFNHRLSTFHSIRNCCSCSIIVHRHYIAGMSQNVVVHLVVFVPSASGGVGWNCSIQMRCRTHNAFYISTLVHLLPQATSKYSVHIFIYSQMPFHFTRIKNIHRQKLEHWFHGECKEMVSGDTECKPTGDRQKYHDSE